MGCDSEWPRHGTRQNKKIAKFGSKRFAILLECAILTAMREKAHRGADVAELADAHGSGPCSSRNVGSTPTVGTIFSGWKSGVVDRGTRGYGITAVHQPSKLVIRVRLPLPAPNSVDGGVREKRNHGGIPEWPKGADCKSASCAFDGSNPSPTTILIQPSSWAVFLCSDFRLQAQKRLDRYSLMCRVQLPVGRLG